MTPAWLRSTAEGDLVERTRYYRLVGGEGLGERLFSAALASLRSVERVPGAGSTAIGSVCDIPGLRSRQVKGFPVRWFYFVADDHLDVVRLLADAQDLVALLGDRI